MYWKELRSVSAVGMIACASMACGQSDKQEENAPRAYVIGAKATAASVAKLGVTRWHSTIEPGPHPVVVVDGQDRHGKVTYLQTVRIDKKTNFMHVDIVLPQRGSAVWDLTHNTLVSDTLPLNVVPYTLAAYRDFPLTHPIDGSNTAYSAASGSFQMWGGIFVASVGVAAVFFGAALALGSGGLATPGAIPLMGWGAATATAGTILAINGAAEVINSATSNPAGGPGQSGVNAVNQVDAAATDASKALDPNGVAATDATGANGIGNPPTDPNATDPNATGATGIGSAGDPNAPAADPNGNPGDPNGATPDQAPPADLPPDNTGGNLDSMGNDPASAGASDPGAGAADPGSSSPGGGVDPGAGASDPGAGASDPGGGGGDTGGGGGGDFARNICRQVAVSKLTQIRACVHY
jgi:hypothetical protein